MIGEPIVRLRAPVLEERDRRGNPVRDWDNAASEELEGFGVAPRLSVEDVAAGRQGVPIGLTLYGPAGADVLPTDRLVVRGKEYEVDGEPADWTSPFTGWAAGIEIQTKRFEG